MRIEKLKTVLIGVCLIVLAACGTPTRTSSTSTMPGVASAQPAPTVSGYGVVQSIDQVRRDQSGLGVGTIAGAVVGGILGNQIGQGTGRTAATVAGAAGGALAGQQIAGARSDQVYRMAVRMDDGSVQTLIQDTPPDLQIGERVRIANGLIVERFR